MSVDGAMTCRRSRRSPLRADGGVLHLTLNRPESRNAMSLAMVRELRAALAAAEADGATRVLVLRGAGGHFCAGADLKDMAAARMSAPSTGAGRDGRGQRAVRRALRRLRAHAAGASSRCSKAR